MRKKIDRCIKAGIVLALLVLMGTVSAQVTYTQNTQQGSLQFGDPYVYLTPIVEEGSCVGAMAHGVFPFKLTARPMQTKIYYEIYDTENNYYNGTYYGNTYVCAGVWFLNRGAACEDFDHGEFWGYCYENYVLKDSAYAYYTWEDSEA